MHLMKFVGVLCALLFSGADAQTTAKTLQDVLAQLKATEAAVNNLWSSSAQLDANATKLERSTAKTMLNETNTSNHLLQLESQTRWNNRSLNGLSYEISELKETLDFERYDLATADKAKASGGTAAVVLAAKANATVTKANLTKLEEIGQKLWAVSNPQAPASLDKTEARLKKMDTEIASLRTQLDPSIKSAMKKKFQRNVDRWRDDNMKLGEIALKQSGELAKYWMDDDGADYSPDAPQYPRDRDGPDVSGDEWFLQTISSKFTEHLRNQRTEGRLRAHGPMSAGTSALDCFVSMSVVVVALQLFQH